MDEHEIERHVYVSLLDHFNAIRTEQDKRIDQALLNARVAVDKAQAAQEHRLDLLNEFRAQQADESRKYALREALEAAVKERDQRLARIEAQISRLYGGLAVLAFIGVANLVRLWFPN